VHWQAALGVLRYLKGTAGYCLCFGAAVSSALTVAAFCDSDYGGDTDTRRSTDGHVFLLYGGAISWSSKRQEVTATSTTEAEYISAGRAAREGLWLRKLLHDLLLPDAVVIGIDNQSALKLIRNPLYTPRAKHIDIVHHFVRERVRRGELRYRFVPTDEMVADILTKALCKAKFVQFRAALGVVP
jgi:hypothetical protein